MWRGFHGALIFCFVAVLPWTQCSDALSSCNVANVGAPFLPSVTAWLDGQDLQWHMEDASLFPETTCPVLRVSSSEIPRSVWLHLLASPQSTRECVSCTCLREMRQQNHGSLIHLHQDVWSDRRSIVQNRILMRLGRFQSRIFARQTQARRIPAATALPFLREHHLWSAVTSKYHYGLFHRPKGGDTLVSLVAVASFSSRRKIRRGNILHKSHELIRFCTRCDSMVVGGITKLLKQFAKDHNPDDIVTVVDRDWGSGEGWHALGFQTVQIMPPLAMVVSKEDGKRRHLVGAGIGQDNVENGRVSLEEQVLRDLNHQSCHEDALHCLEKHGYFPVYDAGVERLFMVIPKGQDKEQPQLSTIELWQQSVPTYTSTFYSDNAGVNALLEHAKEKAFWIDLKATTKCAIADIPLGDSEHAKRSVADWKATGGTATTAALLFSAPSSLDGNATVQVRERPGGWCTLGIVGGRTKSIYHGIYALTKERKLDPSILVSEYLRTMASVALAALEDSIAGTDPLPFLYFGYGAGTLSRFIGYTVPNSQHVSLELDLGVVQAAITCQLLGESSLQQSLHLQDALEYVRDTTQPPFLCLFVDIFDKDNQLPADFYESNFLQKVRQQHLCPYRGIVIHNFHTGNRKQQRQLEAAVASYREVFPEVALVDSLDSRNHAGNTILIASVAPLDRDYLIAAATKSRKTWNVQFDLAIRATHNFRR